MKKILISTTLFLSIVYSAQTWNTTGNSGTNSTTNFIGTTDNQSMSVKTNNIERLKISNTGRFIFHNFTGLGKSYDKNLFLGGGTDNPTTYMNTVLGISALTNNITGSGNTAVGNNAMNTLTNGDFNSVYGLNAMSRANSGSLNSSYGMNSMEGAGIYNENSSFGHMSLRREFATSTDVVSFNSAFGNKTLGYLKNGQNNVAIGYRALMIESGNDNIAIGAHAGSNLSSGTNNILIGKSVNASSSSVSNELNIGNWIYGLDGKISIGGRATFTCSDCTDYSLFVKNGIKAEKVKVDVASANGWADYVFNENYNLKSLEEVEKHINENGHLPNIPSAKEVVENGINVAEMDAKLLEKIEELTLYSIEQNKKIKEQNERIERLEKMLLELTPTPKK